MILMWPFFYKKKNTFSLFLQIADGPLKLQERDFAGTPYVPVYVMLPVRYSNSTHVLSLFTFRLFSFSS